MNNRITELEICATAHERTLEELSDEVFRLSKQVDFLMQQMKSLIESLDKIQVKPLSEETPPPHY